MYSLSERLLSNPQGVKSVQRGICNFSPNVDGEYSNPKYVQSPSTCTCEFVMDIVISKVNPEKCVVLLDHSINKDTAGIVLENIAETNIRVGANNIAYPAQEYKGQFSWQVIEFY